MANNQTDGASEDFLQQFVGFTGTNFSGFGGSTPMMLQLSSGTGTGDGCGAAGVGVGGFSNPFLGTAVSSFPLGLSLEQGREGFMNMEKRFGEKQPKPNSVPAASYLPMIRPRVRARRGQATDPHSIAERIRRERISERVRALQDLVPSVNKTDRAVMVDEIVDYVKFLRLQVKVLSMSRLGGAGSVASSSSLEEENSEAERSQPWEKWSNDGTEEQESKLMEENVGAAMQFLQSKALCIMPISLASAIYHSHPTQNPS